VDLKELKHKALSTKTQDPSPKTENSDSELKTVQVFAPLRCGPYNFQQVSGQWKTEQRVMPIYEFECRKCKAKLEVFQKMNDKPPVKCRKCGGRLEKLVSASAIQFKGSGWYVTDYAGNGRKAAEKAEKDTAASSTSSEDKKSDKKTKESSPAKKTSDKASTSKVPSGD
jgi:putative FmdB family regulatory protein